ncbi:DEAD/DEAH box helicase [Halovivax gelatinilyticus]|uniref:DEAD/DEAH box helicase n=1 Tax=Halovivax gelatinilyticus TaxID=2961597 RepID=UPI0020CA4BD5|nr:DEAD/DEAH box helicase [Halovivax gelatinilyticus]
MTWERLIETYPGSPGAVTVVDVPARPAETVPAVDVLRPSLADALDHDLYAHQAAALDSLDAGEHVCVATSTASGKTLVYGLQIARKFADGSLTNRSASVSSGDVVRHPRSDSTDGATALVVYPTKALSRDQERELNDLYDRLGLDVSVRVYDGDTERGERRREIRETADVILTNFMGVNTYLHDHDRWRRFYRSCELVVIDESHTYTGIHGMHVAWTIRRLQRVLSYYGADPQFVLSSATIGNPAKHSETLIDETVTVIDDDGSPRGPRDLVLWNPPRATDEGDGESDSTVATGDETPVSTTDSGSQERADRLPASVEAPRLFSHLTYHGQQTLQFTPSRKLAELSVERALAHRERRSSYYTERDRATSIQSYHAGHARTSRHATEEGLKSGALAGVASTNALELGVNIGTMDATVQLGYPGQRQSFRQQIGRAGRGTERALSVLVADHRTLDQYVVSNPSYLTEGTVEDAVVDTENDAVFATHVRCAADELALSEADVDQFAPRERLDDAVEFWRRTGQLSGRLETGASYAGPPRPQSSVSMYATAGDEYEVRLADGVDERFEPRLEPLARERVFRDFHEGAVRLHEGAQYEVCRVVHDGPTPHVVVRPVDVEFYTQTNREVTVLDARADRSREIGDFVLHYGTGTVLSYYGTYDQVMVDGGKKRRQGVPTGLPALSMSTQLCWLEVPRDVEQTLVDRYSHVKEPELDGELGDSDHVGYAGGLHAAEHATIGVAPLELMVDSRDLGGLATLSLDAHRTPSAGEPSSEHDSRTPDSIAAAEATIRSRAAALERPPTSGWFIYDGVEGGLGFSRAIYENFEAIAQRALDLIVGCDCGRDDGCPGCIMDDRCGNDNRPLHADAAADVLRSVLNGSSIESSADEPDRSSEPPDSNGETADPSGRPTLFFS